jgi:hypothetical protein
MCLIVVDCSTEVDVFELFRETRGLYILNEPTFCVIVLSVLLDERVFVVVRDSLGNIFGKIS